MNFKDLQQKIQGSTWNEDEKRQLSELAPKFGRRLLDFLIISVGRAENVGFGPQITGAAKLVSTWHELLQNNNTDKIVDQLLEFWHQADKNAEPALFYGIMDIRANTALAHNITEELSRLFNLIQCIYFEKMLLKEVVQMLKDHAASTASFADLSEEVKRYCYLRDIPTEFFDKFKNALEGDSEEIGSEPLNLSSGAVRPAVSNWLKAFGEFRSAGGVRSTYNIAYFVTNHPQATKLPDSEKAVLADILRLYAWILRPEIFPDEIEHFEKEREAYYDSVKNDLIAIAKKSVVKQPQAAIDAVKISKVQAPPESSLTQSNVKLGGVVLGSVKPKTVDDKSAPFKVPEPVAEIDKQFAIGLGKTELGGLVVNEGTNIEINLEAKRLQEERNQQMQSIQNKLEELRKRNNLS